MLMVLLITIRECRGCCVPFNLNRTLICGVFYGMKVICRYEAETQAFHRVLVPYFCGTVFLHTLCSLWFVCVLLHRRAVTTKRAVPVKGQLKSHKMFSKSIDKYVSLVDTARIYSTSTWKGPAEVNVLSTDVTCLIVSIETHGLVLHLLIKFSSFCC